jgi:hypothetical protein
MIGYASAEDLETYMADRGIAIDMMPSVALLLALDYLEMQSWIGERTDPDQDHEWPRNGETAVPAKIKTAQLMLAIMYGQGYDPLAPVGPRVTSESVAGAVAVTYSDKGNQSMLFPAIAALLGPYLAGGLAGQGGGSFSVVRA